MIKFHQFCELFKFVQKFQKKLDYFPIIIHKLANCIIYSYTVYLENIFRKIIESHQMDLPKKLDDSVSISTKIIIIGDSGVGKTNLLTRFCQDSFRDTYTATIGVDFKVKSFHVEDKKYKLQIWDTAGQQRFKNITKSYYKGSAGIILAFSITDENSFDNVQKWMKQIDNNAGNRVIKVLVGTKLDLQQDRIIEKQKAEQLAKKYRIQYFETSSKIGVNVQNVFRELVREINDKYQKEGIVAGVSQHSKIMKGQIQLIETKTEESDCRC